jgi:hypothetical protein
MTRFIPDYEQKMNENQINNVLERCNQWTGSEQNIHCRIHPETESVVLVATGSNGIGFKIFDTCCSGFRQILIEYFGEAVYT